LPERRLTRFMRAIARIARTREAAPLPFADPSIAMKPMFPSRRRALAWAFLSILLGACASTGHRTSADARPASAASPPPYTPLPDDRSPDGLPQRLVLALDGVPYRMFARLQAEGHFAGFHPVSRMVSSFPSLSGVSFGAIGGGEIPDGYQEMRYDPASNKVVGNTLYTLSGRAHQNLPADNAPHTLTHRLVGYMAPYAMAQRDLGRIRAELLASHKTGYVAYLAQTDVILHVDGAEVGERFLSDLDRWLVELQAEVRSRTGRGLMVDLVSDHGSTLVRGREVDLPARLRDCGFRRNDTLAGPRDVAYSLAGIIGSVAVDTAAAQVEPVARCLAGADGVELVAVVRGDRVGVLGADGSEAELWLLVGSGERYVYRSMHGDPLGLLGGAPAGAGTQRQFQGEAQFRASLGAHFPDPLRRLWRAFHGSVKDPSPILLSLADGREAGYRTVRSLAWVRGRGGTHGSLTSNASLGILASNWRSVGDVDCWSAHDALFGADTIAAAHRHVDAERAATAARDPVRAAPASVR
jgi:hypothetical protein